MDPRFEPYFRARVEQIGRVGLTRVSPSGALVDAGAPDRYEVSVFRAVERGMDSSRFMMPVQIRPDAELMLHLAFTELVAQPMRSVRGSQVSRNEVLSVIEADVRRIMEAAAGEKPAGEPLSAHDIVRAVSWSWSELRSASFELWD